MNLTDSKIDARFVRHSSRQERAHARPDALSTGGREGENTTTRREFSAPSPIVRARASEFASPTRDKRGEINHRRAIQPPFAFRRSIFCRNKDRYPRAIYWSPMAPGRSAGRLAIARWTTHERHFGRIYNPLCRSDTAPSVLLTAGRGFAKMRSRESEGKPNNPRSKAVYRVRKSVFRRSENFSENL